MTLTFYTNPMSRGRTARWMLEEIGQPYETKVLEFGAEMKSPAFLAINPMGKVPTLVHNSQTITECGAICLYLADAFPEAGLIGQNRGAYYRWMLFAAGPLDAAITNHALGINPPPERERMMSYGNYKTTCQTLSDAVSQSDFIAGDAFSAVDVFVGAQIGWGLETATIPETPALRAYWERVKSRPARLRAAALDGALMANKSQ